MRFDPRKSLLLSVVRFALAWSQLPNLQPGDTAPSFALQTVNGRIVYKKNNGNPRTSTHPVIFHLFTKRSAFLEALWTNETSLQEFIEYSPGNTHYVFMSSSDSTALEDVLWLRKTLHKAVENYFKRKTNVLQQDLKTTCQRYYKKIRHDKNNDSVEKEPFFKLSQLREHHATVTKDKCGKSWVASWKDRLHFASLPVYDFGNWIPYALMHWPCFGTGCALAQVVIKSQEGEVMLVTQRLDARYDWLPSPHNLIHKGAHYRVAYYGNACHFKSDWEEENRDGVSDETHEDQKTKAQGGHIALVSPGGDCSYFTKIHNMNKVGVKAVIIYSEEDAPIKELSCKGHHCFKPLYTPASMISHKDGIHIKHLLRAKMKLYVSYQFTPQENFFLGIDGQGKLAEVGLFLFPSMKFMAYEAKWFNYKTDLVHNLTGSAKIIHVFNHTLMEGKTGAVRNISLPPLEELQMYRNVELDMSLYCPGKSDYSCPHWDHVVHLTVCCDKTSPLCGEELGRWITPYRRSVGRWLTNITPLLPLFTSETCTLQMKHPFWERAWKPSLDIRLSDHVRFSTQAYSARQEDQYNVPFKIIKLFRGGKFDKNYNKKYHTRIVRIPPETTQVKLVATISGHGSDNNGCAEFCVTSHHFIVNGHSNVQVFKNAATAMGCANRVKDGAVPNEHGTWLYGRDGWCCGMDVVPWVVDITEQVRFGDYRNEVKYFGWFNGTDPHPIRDPGEIIMRSHLVFYKSVQDQFSDEV
nr:uncharacterized protein LOC131781372 [Pocillopora verrucosa]